MCRLTRAALRRALDRFKKLSRVTVVVWVPDGSAFVNECVASVRASTLAAEVVLVAEHSGSLDAAIASAKGEYVAFLGADDIVPPDGLGHLVTAIAGGAAIAVGRRECRSGGRLVPLPPAGAPTDLSVTGKLFRLPFWRAAGLTVDSWEQQARTVAAAMTAATEVAVVADLVCVEHDRDASAPIHEQRRFRADLARARFGALRDVLAFTREVDKKAWCADALEHLLPVAGRDAVGGGGAYFAALQPFARSVVDGLGSAEAQRRPVVDRMIGWVAAHGTLNDVALTLDHFADNPHGLPTTDRLADQPPGLSLVFADAWRGIGPADRQLRSRVLDLLPLEPDRVRLRGNAFTAYGTGRVRSVRMVGSGGTIDVPVRPRSDESANDWAARAWEDRRDSGFEAEIATADLPPSKARAWSVLVSLDGVVATHRVRLLGADPGDAWAVDDAEVGPDGLRIGGIGQPVRARLAGPRGTSPWAEVAAAGGRFEAVLPLVTNLFGEQTRLPGGRYGLHVQEPRGRSGTLGWAPSLRLEPPDLLDDRTGLRLDGDDGLVVGRPLTSHDRSAFARQQRITAYAAVPRPGSRPSVLFESFHGRVVADNPAAIARELAGRGLDLDLVWVVDDPGVTVPDGTRAAPRLTQSWFDALAEAHIYVGNAAAPPWFHKSDGQFHLQTWHGTPLKRIGEDRGPGDFNTWRHRRHLAGQAASWDAMISPSPYCSEIFRSAFRYDGPMLEVGYPRNDVLRSDRAPQVRAATRQRLGLTDADRVLLYAPTWREYFGVRDRKPLFLDPAQVVAALPDTVVLVRGHYNASRQPDMFTDRSRIIDVTRYPDIADLYLAADTLVTDYSSVMFDFALTDKPITLLTPDLDQYRDVERGFYFDIEADAPGPMVTTTDEAVQRLDDADRYADARARFRDRFCPYDDGNASARVCDHLLGLAEHRS